MTIYTLEKIRAEQRIVYPNADKIIAMTLDKPIKDMTAKQLRNLTDSQTIWIPGGDHTWKYYPSIIAGRKFAHRFSRTYRSTGEPECVHGMGSADLAYNFGGLRGIPPEMLVFVCYFHDLKENNRHNKKLTSQRIFAKTWKGDALLVLPGIQLLDLITDTPGLRKEARYEEQIKRANDDETGFVAVVRIIDKLNSGYQDYYNLLMGRVPFSGNLEKLQNYMKAREYIVKNIKNHKHDSVAELKRRYNEVCRATRKVLEQGLIAPLPPTTAKPHSYPLLTKEI